MEIVSLLPLLAIVLLFWFMVVRPANRRQKAVHQLQSSLQPGQRVMLASGLFGTIVSLTDKRLVLEIAPGVQVEAVRGAVSSVDEEQRSADETQQSDSDDSPRTEE